MVIFAFGRAWLRICSPTTGCWRMIEACSGVRGSGLRRISVGTASLPMSCSNATWSTILSSASSKPRLSATVWASVEVSAECEAVYSSRESRAEMSASATDS